MYETLVLVDQDAHITADDIKRQLASLLERPGASRAVLTRDGESLAVKWQGFALDVNRNSHASVSTESLEMAAKFAAGRPERKRIAMSTERIEIAGTDDPGMDYFNDFCLVLEAIEELGPVYTFDLGSGEFMNL